jgi:hypothetical protein
MGVQLTYFRPPGKFLARAETTTQDQRHPSRSSLQRAVRRQPRVRDNLRAGLHDL